MDRDKILRRNRRANQRPNGVAIMLLVYINARTRESALDIGRSLVAAKLAAAVNVMPVESIYRWDGKIHDGEREWTITAKSTRPCFAALVDLVKSMHPNVVPAIQGVEVTEVAPDYAQWIADCTIGEAGV
jgi:periplasmic divalent cation tolerance protein